MNIKPLLVASGLIAATALAGCSTVGGTFYTASYASVTDAGYKLPAIPKTKVPSQYLRQIVKYETSEAPGTVIVDTSAKFLYFIMPDGKAMRYGIGVGKQGFEWSGTARIAMKREWPTWTPPAAMIRRRPELAQYRGGMKPGLQNPLGARALYLFRGGHDTGYRLHGTPEWWSIGKAMSSGCIRLLNQDIMDLYNRVDIGAKVIVK
ncbi:L,D-transpeptidase [Phyllobacterium phragmitis]|uniref:L,D-transpeptidase n=1 Tax=Phyllobacterium phragmitis TaxID=2670329 RepID=A0A2S9ISH1_9HYPH|nr:L,D-transpeptidase [Phyllobacterium phragmitis]PRD43475.1 L,D-transpeptidase [Phyllobacterium phragmitis]